MNLTHHPFSLQRLLCALLLLLAVSVQAAPGANNPPALHTWEDWVLYDHPEVNCPFFHNSGEHHCHWPSQLTLEANDRGATFELQLQLYTDSDFVLPGDHEHWPTAVMVEGRRLAIADQQGIPVGHLPAGNYTGGNPVGAGSQAASQSVGARLSPYERPHPPATDHRGSPGCQWPRTRGRAGADVAQRFYSPPIRLGAASTH